MTNHPKRAKGTPEEAASSPRRRLFRLGPGLIIALIASVIIGGNALKKEYAARQSQEGPIIERHTLTDPIAPTPDIRFLLDRKAKLQLTGQQLAGLEKLQTEWKKTEAPLMREARQREAELNRYLAEAKNARRTPVAQIQEKAEPYIAVSGQLAAERRRHWSRAMAVLTPNQRKIVEAERKTLAVHKR